MSAGVLGNCFFKKSIDGSGIRIDLFGLGAGRYILQAFLLENIHVQDPEDHYF